MVLLIVLKKGAATDGTSEWLDHQNLTITQVYLEELEAQIEDKALEVLSKISS